MLFPGVHGHCVSPHLYGARKPPAFSESRGLFLRGHARDGSRATHGESCMASSQSAHRVFARQFLLGCVGVRRLCFVVRPAEWPARPASGNRTALCSARPAGQEPALAAASAARGPAEQKASAAMAADACMFAAYSRPNGGRAQCRAAPPTPGGRISRSRRKLL